jgi:ferric-dicitrate binding protein FerR (iron transport regulator)
MEDKYEPIDALIARFLSGEATAAEREELLSWRLASDENEEYFLDLMFIFNASAKKQPLPTVDAQKAWDHIAGKISPAEVKTVPLAAPVAEVEKKNSSAYLWKVAAVAVFLISIALVVYQLSKDKPGKEIALDIQSGKNNLTQVLPDGSRVDLKPNSSLLALKNKDNPAAREYSFSGDAQFEVKHDEKQPFILHAGNTLIRDIGTVFEVKAFDNKDTIKVYVESGSVQFYSPEQSGLMLKAKESGIYLSSSGKFFRPEPKAESNELEFDNTPLEEVVAQLNAHYGAHIVLGNENLRSCTINVHFRNYPLSKALDIISNTLSLTVKTENHVTTLYGKGCK